MMRDVMDSSIRIPLQDDTCSGRVASYIADGRPRSSNCEESEADGGNGWCGKHHSDALAVSKTMRTYATRSDKSADASLQDTENAGLNEVSR